MRVGIVGAGPGGLIAAYLLERKYGEACSITMLEASDCAGGKLQTRRFDAAPVPYEAGAAEVNDYRALGPDPLAALIERLGLETVPMQSQAVVIDGTMLHGPAELLRHYGTSTFAAIQDFHAKAAALLTPDRWRPGDWRTHARHPWAYRSCAELLEEVEDPAARRYLRLVTHSDLATEPHLTDGLTGLKNFVMDLPGHVERRVVRGGMGEIARRLAEEIHTRVQLKSRVLAVEAPEDDCWRIHFARTGQVERCDVDAIVLALPAVDLAGIEWRGDTLCRAMDRHLSRFDRPGHYLRVALLFDQPFWSRQFQAPWFMSEAFGGACVYDESARFDTGGYGVLSFLIAGNAALALGNSDDDAIVKRVLASLPASLRTEGRARWIEARVHRWAGCVSARPGGSPVMDPRMTHQPDARELPGLVLVGNYLFDATLNGVYRSADLATTLLATRIRRHGRAFLAGKMESWQPLRRAMTNSLPGRRHGSTLANHPLISGSES